MMKVLVIGDIIGKPGRDILQSKLRDFITKNSIEFVVANAENSAGGLGITCKIAEELFLLGVNVLTSGNHIWKQREIYEVLAHDSRILRPANYPPGAPGLGWSVHKSLSGVKVGVLNLEGRVFMRSLDCPFRVADEVITEIKKKTDIIFVDFHAEATSEKIALGRYLDGKVTCVFGTHTHVQTSDNKIFTNGTAYITDVGMTGPHDSIIGRSTDKIIFHFLTQMPSPFDIANGDVRLNGAVIDVDVETGRALSIERVDTDCTDL